VIDVVYALLLVAAFLFVSVLGGLTAYRLYKGQG
jgi:hypothetical protein